MSIHGEKKREHERLHRLMKKIRARLRHIRADDPLTANEKNSRDVWFRPWVRPLRARGWRANHITAIGLLLVVLVQLSIWNVPRLIGWPGHFITLLLGIAALFSDAFDGAMARYRDPVSGTDDVTGFGTFFDHFRDAAFSLVFGINTLFGFENISAVEYLFVFLSGITYTMVAVVEVAKNWSAPSSSEEVPAVSLSTRMNTFFLNHMQTTFWGRVQSGLLASAVISLFIGNAFGVKEFSELSLPLFGAQIALTVHSIITERLEVGV